MLILYTQNHCTEIKVHTIYNIYVDLFYLNNQIHLKEKKSKNNLQLINDLSKASDTIQKLHWLKCNLVPIPILNSK